MTKLLSAYAIAALVFLSLDGLWLGLLARRWYADALGELLRPTPRWGAAGAFYALYLVGVVVFAIVPSLDGGPWWKAGALGALFGLVAYGTYDLTNLSVLRGWPLGLSLLDMAWGSAATAAAATVAHLVLSRSPG